MQTMLCSVSGIDSKENKTEIKNALKKIDGVQSVGVNLAGGSVSIDYNTPATEAAIKDRIERSGFKIIYE